MEVGVVGDRAAEVGGDPAGGAEGGEAGERVIVVDPDVLVDQGLEHRPAGGGEGVTLDQGLADRPGLLQDPGVHRRDQGVSRDEVHLERQDAEEEVAVGVAAGHAWLPMSWPGDRLEESASIDHLNGNRIETRHQNPPDHSGRRGTPAGSGIFWPLLGEGGRKRPRGQASSLIQRHAAGRPPNRRQIEG
jgi:hypothetical protein